MPVVCSFFESLKLHFCGTPSRFGRRALPVQEKMEFVKKSVSWISSNNIMDTCFVLNYGYEFPLPWPQVWIWLLKRQELPKPNHGYKSLLKSPLKYFARPFAWPLRGLWRGLQDSCFACVSTREKELLELLFSQLLYRYGWDWILQTLVSFLFLEAMGWMFPVPAQLSSLQVNNAN